MQKEREFATLLKSFDVCLLLENEWMKMRMWEEQSNHKFSQKKTQVEAEAAVAMAKMMAKAST